MDTEYNTIYQNIYNYKNITKYIILLFIFFLIIYLIMVFNKLS
jgi:hypothetical protein